VDKPKSYLHQYETDDLKEEADDSYKTLILVSKSPFSRKSTVVNVVLKPETLAIKPLRSKIYFDLTRDLVYNQHFYLFNSSIITIHFQYITNIIHL